MRKTKLLFRLLALVACIMCALGAVAAEAYACYTPDNTTLTFYYDTQRASRTGTTYDMNTGSNSPGWYSDGIYSSVTRVVFDASFADARPTSAFYWFSEMNKLQTIEGLANLNTSEVTNMASMFSNCRKLTSLDLSTFNTDKVTTTDCMFLYCTGLTSVDLSGFTNAKLTRTANMFQNCSALTTIYADSNWSLPANNYSWAMFMDCTSLVGGKGTAYDENHTDDSYAHLDGGPSNPGYFTGKSEAYACYTQENTTLTFYYDNERASRTGTTYDLNTGTNYPGWYSDGTYSSVTRAVFDPSFVDARPTTTTFWFYKMSNLQSITDMEYLNTTTVTDMSHMFRGCSNVTSLDVSNFNTANVTFMRGIFQDCSALTTIYAGDGWSTEALTTTLSSRDMFYGCTKLVGGMGTTYDANHVDKAYAHIDGGPSNPGYFTEKPEAYACFTQENTTLTFYYDNQRSSRTGTTFDLNEGSNAPRWYIEGFNSRVKNVVFDPSFADARPTTTYFWFNNMTSLTSITGMEYLNTSEVTDMSYLFFECTSLTSLDLSSFNTSKVTSMKYMFFNCVVLANLDVSSFNTANVTDMGCMFTFCYALKSLDLSSFNTANVTNMGSMFTTCPLLTTIYAGDGWNTDAVTTSGMFGGCTNLVGGMGTAYDASHVDKTYAHIDGGPSNPGYFTDKTIEAYACYTPGNTTLTFYRDNLRSTRQGTTYDLNTDSNVPGWYIDGTNASVTKVVFDPLFAYAHPTTTYCWFYNMRNLTTITGMSYLNTSKVTDMAKMFANCVTLPSLDLSHFNTSKVTRMSAMFDSCNKLTSLDLSSFNTATVTNMNDMFFACTQLKTIYVRLGWSTSAVTTSSEMFMNCTSIKGGQGTTYDTNHIDATYAHIDGGSSNPGYFTGTTEAYACYTPENTTLTFYRDGLRASRSGTTYDLNEGNNSPGWYSDGTNVNVTKVVFGPSFANARPTTTYYWFWCMRNLQSITGMSYLNTSEVTNMSGMFGGCESLTSLDVSSFNTAKVTDMAGMFSGCYALTDLDLRSFNTSRVTNMANMFGASYRLTSLDVSNFNTSRVTNMNRMFSTCNALTSLDLSSFNTANVTDMYDMFIDCNNLATIYVSNAWSTASVTSSGMMFLWCFNLVGGMGTAYDDNHVQEDYAHIDGGPSNPGYFTAKNASLRGDVDADGNITISDVTALIDYLLSDNASGVNLTAADCDLDGGITISDVTSLIDYLLSGSW